MFAHRLQHGKSPPRHQGTRKNSKAGRGNLQLPVSYLLIFVFWSFFVPWCLSGAPPGTEYHGQVTFGGLPAPGATVTAIQGSKRSVTITDQQGLYSLPDLTDGKWTIEVQMTGFSLIKQDVVIGPNAPAAKWELKLLPLDQIKAEIAGARHGSPLQPAGGAGRVTPEAESEQPKPPGANMKEPSQDDLSERASDGFLINGSVNNSAASPFAQPFAFGNNRNAARGLYNGGIGLIFDNSALDARPFSLSGQNTPKPAYNRITGMATLGGPLRIPLFCCLPMDTVCQRHNAIGVGAGCGGARRRFLPSSECAWAAGANLQSGNGNAILRQQDSKNPDQPSGTGLVELLPLADL
jgi:hypothetical protein